MKYSELIYTQSITEIKSTKYIRKHGIIKQRIHTHSKSKLAL